MSTLMAPGVVKSDAEQVVKVKTVENAKGTRYKFEGLPTSLKGGGNKVAPEGVGRDTVNLGAGNDLVICTETKERTNTAHAAASKAVTVTVTTKGPKATAMLKPLRRSRPRSTAGPRGRLRSRPMR